MVEKKTRRQFLTATGAGAVTALAGCQGSTDDPANDEDTETSDDGSTSESPETDTEGSSGGTLQMMADGAIQTLDPINAKGSGAAYNQYGRSLLEFDNGHYPPEPALADDYEMSDDGLTYTFHLKEEVTFHDGSEFTAHDVVYSWERLAGSERSRNRDDLIGETMVIEHEKDASRTEPTDEETLEDYVPGSLAIEAVDDHTFEMTLAQPFEYTLFQIAGGAFAILPEGAVGDVEGYDGEYEYNEFFSTANGGPKYAGLGPFEIESWTKGDQIRLTAFDDYYGEGPKLDGITYTIVTSGNTRLNRFRNGNADILEGMPTASFNPDNVTIEDAEGNADVGSYAFDDGTTVNYGEIASLSTEYLVFNALEVPLAVRRAFAYALNQHDVAENVYKGVAKPAYHITPPAPYPTFEQGMSGEEAYDRHAEEGYRSTTEFGADGYPYGYGETRLEDARRVMEEAGYGADDRFSITATTITGDSGYQQVFSRLQSKLRSAYVDVEIEEAEFGTIISRAISGDMEVFALGDGMEYPGPQNFLRFLHGQNAGNQFTRWGAEGSHYTEEYWQTAREAWDQKYAADDATETSRNEAFQTVEEMNWASVQELPTVHEASQRFWHDHVDVEMYGVMGSQTFDDVTLNR